MKNKKAYDELGNILCDLSYVLETDFLECIHGDNRWDSLHYLLTNNGIHIEDKRLGGLFVESGYNRIFKKIAERINFVHNKENREDLNNKIKFFEEFWKNNSPDIFLYEAVNDSCFSNSSLWGPYHLTFGFLVTMDCGSFFLYSLAEDSIIHNDQYRKLLSLSEKTDCFNLISPRYSGEDKVESINRVLDNSTDFFAPKKWNPIDWSDALKLISSVFSQNFVYGSEICDASKTAEMGKDLEKIIDLFSGKNIIYTNLADIEESIAEKRIVSNYDLSNNLFDCAIALVDDSKVFILITTGDD